ncbi:hypothetical protein LASUN_04290 [Lentilactobacillus sunkii]|uniref:Restriction endonuclease n=1 Tax=Lentilactobacillus sunkii TaxID=481719 RepID=A0A1E7XIB4_9LACO|nr:hypothetical protein [Lentilactobacillus sunkii]OFA12712.1 hypothetical protein LASUN_04290 [Lentilactobacillus sunkii]
MKNNIISNYLQSKNFDIRKSHNGRWMDQKVTPDVLSLTAQTVLDYTKNINAQFTNRDLYQSEDFLQTVAHFFGKPARAVGEMENEYNKFIGQPLKTLSYAGLLFEDQRKRPFVYSINNKNILELLAQSDKKSLLFLQSYIKKCLSDSGFDELEKFLSKKQKTQNDFYNLRDDFIKFEIDNTAIKKELEPRRILAKVLNPLAFEANSQGAHRGHLSHENIRITDLRYDGDNSQDAHKEKNISRQEYRLIGNEYTHSYRIEKAIRAVRTYNAKFNFGLSETGSGEQATQGHHMLPKSKTYYPQFATYCENIIMLSPNEHYLKAHKDNKTETINLDYQKKLLYFKKANILKAMENHPDESPYDYDLFINMIKEYSYREHDPEILQNVLKRA